MHSHKAPRCFEITGDARAVESANVQTLGGNLARLLLHSVGLPTHDVRDQLLLVILGGKA